MHAMIIASHLIKENARSERSKEMPQVLQQASAGFQRSMIPVIATFVGIAAFATALTFVG